MNFTREPIIETVITPREGCKLVVRSSKGVGQEDYHVEALEVVSFGHSFFFRSQDRPNSFLVPVSDYEVLELKETRMGLKNVGGERSIKIGGGRDAPVRSQPAEASEPIRPEGEMPAPPMERQGDRKQRDRRRGRRRRGGERMDRLETPPLPTESRIEHPPFPVADDGEEKFEERPEEAKPSFISKLFPPPQTLIKETLGRYKIDEENSSESKSPPATGTIFEHPDREESDGEDEKLEE